MSTIGGRSALSGLPANCGRWPLGGLSPIWGRGRWAEYRRYFKRRPSPAGGFCFRVRGMDQAADLPPVIEAAGVICKALSGASSSCTEPMAKAGLGPVG